MLQAIPESPAPNALGTYCVRFHLDCAFLDMAARYSKLLRPNGWTWNY